MKYNDAIVHVREALFSFYERNSNRFLLKGYEDKLRHKADKEVNNRPAQILKDAKLVTVKAEQIRVSH